MIFHKLLMMFHENLEHYNPTKIWKVLIALDDIIAAMESKKRISTIATKLFSRGRTLNISPVFIPQSYFKVCKTINLNATNIVLSKFQAKELKS